MDELKKEKWDVNYTFGVTTLTKLYSRNYADMNKNETLSFPWYSLPSSEVFKHIIIIQDNTMYDFNIWI